MIKILIVDDEDMMREAAKPYFERKGYQVFYAGTGKDGLEVFKKEAPDITLLDLGLPDIDGKEVFIKMRELNRSSRIIVLTGFGEDEINKEIRLLGPDAYFTKPCKLPAVADTIAQMVKT